MTTSETGDFDERGLDDAENPERRTARIKWLRRAWWSLGAFGVVLGIVAVLAACAWVYGRVERISALEKLRAAGEPVTPEELDYPRHEDAERFERWHAEMKALPGWDYVAPSDVPACVEEAKTSERAAEWVQDDLRFEDDLLDALVDPMQALSLTECQRAVLKELVRKSEPEWRKALEIEGLSGPNWRERLTRGDDLESLIPAVEGQQGRAAESLLFAALDAVHRGEHAEAVHRVALAFEVERAWRWAPTLTGFGLHRVTSFHACHALRATLLAIPRGVDLSALDVRLEGPPARELARYWLRAERAIGIRIYDALRRDTLGPHALREFEGIAGLSIGGWLDYDELDWLRRFEGALKIIDEPFHTSHEQLRAIDADPPASWCFVSLMMTPRMERVAELIARHDADQTFARACLIAYRDGVEAAHAWVTAQPDPFGEGRLRARIDDDGVLTMWSVGSNEIDDGAPPPPWDPAVYGSPFAPDEVVRFRPR